MGEGQFNIADFIRRIGLKNIREMPVIESVQPVSVVGDQSGLTPRYEAPSGYFGGNVGPVAGQRAIMELTSLGLGGCVVKAFVVQSIANIITQIGDPVIATAATLAGLTSNETPLSLGRLGNAVAPGGVNAFLRPDQVYPIEFYLPRGQAFRLLPDTDNVSIFGTVWFADVPASEHGTT